MNDKFPLYRILQLMSPKHSFCIKKKKKKKTGLFRGDKAVQFQSWYGKVVVELHFVQSFVWFKIKKYHYRSGTIKYLWCLSRQSGFVLNLSPDSWQREDMRPDDDVPIVTAGINSSTQIKREFICEFLGETFFFLRARSLLSLPTNV